MVLFIISGPIFRAVFIHAGDTILFGENQSHGGLFHTHIQRFAIAFFSFIQKTHPFIFIILFAIFIGCREIASFLPNYIGECKYKRWSNVWTWTVKIEMCILGSKVKRSRRFPECIASIVGFYESTIRHLLYFDGWPWSERRFHNGELFKDHFRKVRFTTWPRQISDCCRISSIARLLGIISFDWTSWQKGKLQKTMKFLSIFVLIRISLHLTSFW